MPTAAPTPCPTCATLDPCPHRGAARRTRATRQWTDRSRQLLDAWRTQHGDWCPGWPPTGHQPHQCDDLTIHHLDRLADVGGTDTGRYAVLCRAENARIG